MASPALRWCCCLRLQAPERTGRCGPVTGACVRQPQNFITDITTWHGPRPAGPQFLAHSVLANKFHWASFTSNIWPVTQPGTIEGSPLEAIRAVMTGIANMSKVRDKMSSSARTCGLPARSHPRKRGACSALRHAADSGCNTLTGLNILRPCRAGAILARGGVPALANISDIRCGLLLVPSQNRVSASRVSSCQAL